MQNYQSIVDVSHQYIALAMNTSDPMKSQDFRLKAIECLETFVSSLQITDYLLLDSTPTVPQKVYIECLFNLGTLMKNYAENSFHNTGNFTKDQKDLFDKSIYHFHTILRVQFEDSLAVQQIVSIYTQLCFHHQQDPELCRQFLHEALFFSPDNQTIHII